MTDMISQDFLGMGTAPIVKVEHITTPHLGASAERGAVATKDEAEEDAVAQERAEAPAASGEAADAAETAAGPLGAEVPEGQAIVSSMEDISYDDVVGYD